MSDTREWLHQAQQHVGTAQIVLDEVGKGLASVERVEVAAERAVPVLRTVVLVALGCAVGHSRCSGGATGPWSWAAGVNAGWRSPDRRPDARYLLPRA